MAEPIQKTVYFPEIPPKEELLNPDKQRIDGRTGILPGTITASLVANLPGENTAFGEQALSKVIFVAFDGTGKENTAFGFQSLYTQVTATNNTAIGWKSLRSNTTGAQNTGVGHNSLFANTTGNLNIAIGMRTLDANTTGSSNIAIGDDALGLNNGESNTAIGSNALGSNTSGSDNLGIGLAALVTNTTGNFNVAVGESSLNNNSTGNNNTSIGFYAGYTSLGSNNVFLGYSAGYFETGSNKLYIANSDTATPLIYGLFTGTGAGITIHSQATDGIPLIVKGIASQASDLQNWQTSVAGVLAKVSSTGVITAPNFVSTVAIGTQPYATTSTTLNTNLNADLLDSQSGAYYLDSANFTGTNWTDLTDGGTTTLHSHSIYFLKAGDTITDGGNIALGTVTGTKIGTATNQLLAFYNQTPVDQPAALTTQLTTITHTAPGADDFAIQDLTQTTPFGFVTKDEGNTVLKVIANLQTRLAEVEARLEELGLVATN